VTIQLIVLDLGGLEIGIKWS